MSVYIMYWCVGVYVFVHLCVFEFVSVLCV